MTRNLTKKDVQKWAKFDLEMIKRWSKEHYEYYDGECPDFENGTCNECSLCEYYN